MIMNEIKKQLDEKIGDMSSQAQRLEQQVWHKLTQKPRKNLKMPALTVAFISIIALFLVLQFFPKEQKASFNEWLPQQVFDEEVYRNYKLSWHFADEATVKRIIFSNLKQKAALAYYASEQGVKVSQDDIQLATIEQQKNMIEATNYYQSLPYIYQHFNVDEESYAKEIVAPQQKLALYEAGLTIDEQLEKEALLAFNEAYAQDIANFKKHNAITDTITENNFATQQAIDSFMLSANEDISQVKLPFTALTLHAFETQMQQQKDKELLAEIKDSYRDKYNWQGLEQEFSNMKTTTIIGEVTQQQGNRYLIVDAQHNNDAYWLTTEQDLQLGQRVQVFEDKSFATWQALRYPKAQLTQEQAIAKALQTEKALTGIKRASFVDGKWQIILQQEAGVKTVEIVDERS